MFLYQRLGISFMNWKFGSSKSRKKCCFSGLSKPDLKLNRDQPSPEPALLTPLEMLFSGKYMKILPVATIHLFIREVRWCAHVPRSSPNRDVSAVSIKPVSMKILTGYPLTTSCWLCPMMFIHVDPHWKIIASFQKNNKFTKKKNVYFFGSSLLWKKIQNESRPCHPRSCHHQPWLCVWSSFSPLDNEDLFGAKKNTVKKKATGKFKVQAIIAKQTIILLRNDSKTYDFQVVEIPKPWMTWWLQKWATTRLQPIAAGEPVSVSATCRPTGRSRRCDRYLSSVFVHKSSWMS